MAETVALLATIVKRRGLNPIAFQVSYREGAAMLGISHEAFRQRVLRAEKTGAVVRIDPGLQGSGGRYTNRPGGGAKTLYALVPAGDTPDHIRVKADAHHAVIRRRAFVQSERDRLAQLALAVPKRAEPLMPKLADRGPALLAYARSLLETRENPPSVTVRTRGPDREAPPPVRSIVEIQSRIRENLAEQRNDSS